MITRILFQGFRNKRPKIILFFAGAIAGYIIFHPYAMLANLLLDSYSYGGVHLTREELLQTLRSILHLDMMPMSFAFAIFGGAIGFLSGVLRDKKRRLREAELENLKRTTAVETLQRIMITLSHYLLNANTVIGGNARRRNKYGTAEELVALLAVIDEESRKIEAVVKALRRTTELKASNYTAEGQGLMIDIAKEIETLTATRDDATKVGPESP